MPEQKQCQYCAEIVDVSAEICPKCKSRLKPLVPQAQQLPRITPPSAPGSVPPDEASNAAQPRIRIKPPPPRPGVSSTEMPTVPYNTHAADAVDMPNASPAPAENAYEWKSQGAAGTGKNSVMAAACISMFLILLIGLSAMQVMSPMLKQATLLSNMQQVQKAAEKFRSVNGRYPSSEQDWNATMFGQVGPPVNPYTNHGELPVVRQVVECAKINDEVARLRSDSSASTLTAGQIEYIPLSESKLIRGYAVRAADGKGDFVRDQSHAVVVLTQE